MNPCMPDWDFAGEVPVSNQMKSTGQAHELVELLWQNGEVVLHSQTQTQRKPNEPRNIQNQTIRGTGSNGNSNNLIQDDETVSWIQSPLEDPFEKEFYSHFFSELPPSALEVHKQTGQLGEEKMIKFDSPSVVTNLQQSNVNHSSVSGLQKNSMPPPRFESQDAAQQTRSFGELGKVVNFSHFAAPFMAEIGSCSGQFDQECSQNFTQGEVRNCSMMTVGSSHCDSNQVVYDLDMSRASSNGMGTTARSSGNLKDDVQKGIAQNGRGKIETLEPTVTSSSGGSGSSFNRTSKQSTGDNSLKRKSRDAGESECQSEATEFESGAGNKTAQRSGSCRKSRAAEVHNLSERRRRDRINERMRALQELIPHCNKTDKASMLDEAIEYLKSLQLQLQMMWMGSGMAPMMFPGVHHYISRMGMGMGPPLLPSVPNSMHFSRVPLGGQTMSMAQAQNQAVNALCQTSLSNPVNYQNQMQNPKFSDQYARYMGFHPMQANSQPTNMFRFGSPALQSHVLSPPSSGCGTFTGGAAATDNAALSGKMG